MAQFIITCTARASISERWLYEAESEEAAKEAFWNGDPGRSLLSEQIDGDEEDREFVEIDVPAEPGIYASEAVSTARTTIDRHNACRGWEIDDEAHGLAMLLIDLIQYADLAGIDFDREVRHSRETIADLKADEVA